MRLMSSMPWVQSAETSSEPVGRINWRFHSCSRARQVSADLRAQRKYISRLSKPTLRPLVSPPDEDREFPGPYASTRTTVRPRSRRRRAVKAPNTPAPTTTTSGADDTRNTGWSGRCLAGRGAPKSARGTAAGARLAMERKRRRLMAMISSPKRNLSGSDLLLMSMSEHRGRAVLRNSQIGSYVLGECLMPKLMQWEHQIGRRLRLRDLFVYFTVAEQGSMAKAASKLGVSTPSISEVVAGLEHALGVRLLDRSSKGVVTTQYGEAVLARGRAAFDELRQGIRDIDFIADPHAGELRIGCPEPL